MKVFLTGATGYIGSAIATALQAANHEVSGLARSATSQEKLRSHHIQPILGDLHDSHSLIMGAQQADAVIHVAASNDADIATHDRRAVEVFLSTLEGTGKTFIYTSGTWILGNTGDTIADETSPVNPTPLIAWRTDIEPLVLAAKERNIRTIVIRPALVYGHGGGLVAMLVQSGLQQGVVQFVGDGQNRWTLVHVEDLARCYVAALDHAPSGSLFIAADDRQVFPLSVIAEAASHAAAVPGQTRSQALTDAQQTMGVFADALVLDQQVSAAKARQVLDWQPQAPSLFDELKGEAYAIR
ncbi:MAG: NAD-dependent epimerase/dehydratase family protein [Drouetiella hepatica Uher 2000/2452]|jgi:nucleoside-diphosphate-sugar epimerase|uniref:NAD-dependent epimerase/dehydratase family protein n=1 Tax=Drouetiella hepatica Uher 2000/2452 TaxID=904376 RepID=A0A951UR16_9CYAN|nr:NAD-dependent epimerase/dehydratase family protein [Drouetiella hepatica Uher 2000/2452]